jgi:hypothetical protein
LCVLDVLVLLAKNKRVKFGCRDENYESLQRIAAMFVKDVGENMAVQFWLQDKFVEMLAWVSSEWRKCGRAILVSRQRSFLFFRQDARPFEICVMKTYLVVCRSSGHFII